MTETEAMDAWMNKQGIVVLNPDQLRHYRELRVQVGQATRRREARQRRRRALIWTGMILASGLFWLTLASSAKAANASCYGPGLYGNSTANGTTLTRTTIGVAHKTLPLWNGRTGTRLWIRANGLTVLAPVIDRGPFVAGRSLDLTHGTVNRLGFRDCWHFGHRPVLTWRVR